MPHATRWLPLFALALSPLAFADQAASDPRIERVLADLARTRPISMARLSPDGQRLAWVVGTKGKPMVEVAKADGSDAHPVASIQAGSCSQTDIAWAPDSRHLAFLSDCGNRDKHKDLFVADVTDAKGLKKLSVLKGPAQDLNWAPNGRELGFLYVENGTRRSSALEAAKPAEGEIGVDGVEVQRVAAVAAEGGTPRLLTPAGSHVYEFAWSPDAQRLAFVAAPPPGDNNWWIAKLLVQDAQPGATARTVVDPATTRGPLHGLQLALPSWSPDGQRIAFIGGLMSDQGATGGDIYSVPATGGEPANLTPGIHVTPVWLTWKGGARMLVSQLAGGQSQVAEYTVTAAAATQERVLFTLPATIGDGRAAMSLSLSDDQARVAFVQHAFDAAPEVHAGPLAQTPPPAVTHLNADSKPSWGKAESVEWEHDGRRVQGWLIYPAGYDPSKTYPMVVNVHGGPASTLIPHWPRVGYGGIPFAALGYFVFLPNPRGSFGQGEAFVQANRKDFGYGDLGDTLAGIDAIEKRLPVDDQRLGLTGWSYGGFMSMFAPTQTQRFKAVVAGAGIGNWQSYYGQNLIDQWMPPYFGATVYDDPSAYAKSSAVNFIKKTTAPTLVVVGDRDAECPAAQSLEFWHALRAQGVATSLVIYPNEGHHFVDPEHQRDVLQRALLWFQKYLPAAP
ncbi:S9 family peptidase [Dyella marensis]|uniref:Dipeptidyl aminopeptidase/acylaminoacyl peptidase n=1 Tax=Dyella marensis TaxID=500610 RepID=A0A1I2GKF1_9GAMM|nr:MULTISPECIES: S9 family peptidase [Dyella]SFF17307.1 Dipeptidyl aminopeptidase/acylaminoacyl peptidase [Dyella marensis]